MKLGLQLGYWGAGPPAGAQDLVVEAERLGYDSVWTAESWGSDALTPLAWWGSPTSRVRLGTDLMQLSERELQHVRPYPGLNREALPMQAGCDQAGLYYVPAYTERSDETISRYADLALRHKTCVVVEGDAQDLLSAIAAKRSIKATSLDTGSGATT